MSNELPTDEVPELASSPPVAALPLSYDLLAKPSGMTGTRLLKLQYFIVFAVNGCLVPFMPLYFQQMGLSDKQIGDAMALASLAVVLSPALVTLIADVHLEARKVLSIAQILTAASLFVLPMFSGFLGILCAWLAVSIWQVPTNPLQDGINFAIQQKRKSEGLKETPYHRIRVWGTIGFLSPGLLLYVLVHKKGDVTVVIYMAAVFALIGACNALFLPKIARADKVIDRRLPTLEAAKALFAGPMLVFCLALFLIQMAAACYYSFYPVYLSRGLGIGREWIGMIMNLGVMVEILFMLSFGRIYAYLGPRRFMLTTAGVMGLRMLLLAAFPYPSVAIGTQAFHGMMVLLITVAPATIVNSIAKDNFRHSIQGLYTMLVLGGGRIIGSHMAGRFAARSYQSAYWWAVVLMAAAMMLLYFGYQRKTQVRSV